VEGLVEIDGVDVRDVDLQSLRKVVSMVSDNNEIFPGTITENVCMGRPEISHSDLMWALDMVRFTELSHFADGLHTQLGTGGKNLSRGQVQKLLLARAIVKRPRLLIFDEAFTAIEESAKLDILERLYAPEQNWTIIDISHDADSILRSDRIVMMDQGTIVESGTPQELIKRVDGRLERLFPQLVHILRVVDRNDPRWQNKHAD
jgi:ATP-binding cassette subfamily B protein